ncbi:MAG: hypothetical protein LBP62_06375 [Clostridiales bacterium]|jgi:hypothetical protein|nr:hypothetical protein [Clostridiales bacterium]
MKIRINKDKNIGKVIYVVEGQKKELTLLKHIFTKIFDYTYVTYRYNDVTREEYRSDKNKNSIVFAVNTNSSNVISIQKGQDYLDEVYKKLYEEYLLDSTKAAVYYIFDRDRRTNSPEIISDLLSELRNSRDNEKNANGLLLLSYPSIESYVIECFAPDCCVLKIESAQKAKRFIGEQNYQQSKINENTFKKATEEMIKTIERIECGCFQIEELDDFANKNKSIFKKQESLYESNNYYEILSLLTISFLDLGLLSVEE